MENSKKFLLKYALCLKMILLVFKKKVNCIKFCFFKEHKFESAESSLSNCKTYGIRYTGYFIRYITFG